MTSKEPKFRSVGKVLTGGTANTIYTCPPNYIAKMTLLFISNHAGNNKTVQIQWNDISASGTYHIVGGYNLASNAYLKLDGSYLVLNAGDSIIVTPEAGSTMDSTITVEEFFEPTQRT
jgi:hypothetical protein